MTPRTPARVTIIGGGITGLSAAHELACRGFAVRLIEREPADHAPDCKVGGMAATQYGIADPTQADRPDLRLTRPARHGSRDAQRLPGEHGFRFFPAFYRHLSDTMGRTPQLDAEGQPTGRTALDRLVPAERVRIETPDPARRLEMSRSRPRTLAGLQALIRGLTHGLSLTPRDLARYQLKLFRYATSGPGRRAECEQISWWDWVGGPDFSPAMQAHLRGLPRILVGMHCTHMDARSHGTVGLQLLLDQLDGTQAPDRVLDGPTSEAWLAPWRQLLEAWGVDFVPATVAALTWSEGAGLAVLDPTGARLDDWGAETPAFVVLAVDAQQAQRLVAGLPDTGLDCDGDVAQLRRWTLNPTDRPAAPEEPLQTLTGVQFFLPGRHDLVQGHLYLEGTPWALSAVSQRQFWGADHLGPGDPGTILSVDVCDWTTPGRTAAAGRPAQGCTRQQIVAEVWDQLVAALPEGATLPRPTQVHLDEHLLTRPAPDGDPAHATVVDNRSPFLTNPIGDWARRPGQPGPTPVALGSLVLAGTYMRTHTRLTCMESANESARHAVNGILAALRTATGVRASEPCRIWNPEDHELRELAFLKGLDEDLLQAGLPHFCDILDLDELDDRVEHGLRLLELLGRAARGTALGGAVAAFDDLVQRFTGSAR